MMSTELQKKCSLESLISLQLEEDLGLTASEPSNESEVRSEIEQLPRFRLYATMLEQDKGNRINSPFANAALNYSANTSCEH
jgi:hypothetical protein